MYECLNCGKKLTSDIIVCPECEFEIIIKPTMPVKKIWTYRIYALFFGFLGIHNFYANRDGVAIIQFLLTIFTCCTCGILSELWAIVEIFIVKNDGNGNIMK